MQCYRGCQRMNEAATRTCLETAVRMLALRLSVRVLNRQMQGESSTTAWAERVGRACWQVSVLEPNDFPRREQLLGNATSTKEPQALPIVLRASPTLVLRRLLLHITTSGAVIFVHGL
jgi:hypothetical protein